MPAGSPVRESLSIIQRDRAKKINSTTTPGWRGPLTLTCIYPTLGPRTVFLPRILNEHGNLFAQRATV